MADDDSDHTDRQDAPATATARRAPAGTLVYGKEGLCLTQERSWGNTARINLSCDGAQPLLASAAKLFQV
ncbi:hypothetical protein RRG08_027035 [Elysia crispata]|uniref:Uncharacterized protein n=1 Tax=Elysia crispata TaxID=231223 RepID=A0AAE0ZHT2_9GAST|nr:hypothetical protein RRG08_027035 [Elysia crispata]